MRTESKALLSIILGALTSYMHLMAVPLIILVAAMIIDYISGLMKAWAAGELSSKIGRQGILRKTGYMLLVCVAGVVDWLIFSGLTKIGITLEFSFCFGLIVTIWLIINELISILENLAALDVPMPGFLKSVVKHLRNAVEAKGDAEVAESEEKNERRG